ncbi:MAG: glycosyltransferase [Kiritimatiellae bacterium]|nr:glycosyltransferase [Kiritimatiellia bacterium]
MACDPLELSTRRPELSARQTLWRRQRVALLLGLAAAALLLVIRPGAVGRAFVLVSTLFYLFSTLYKFLLIHVSVVADSQIQIDAAELARLDERTLPVYSVLVPLYNEPESVAALVDALRRMDYPAEKRDVQLLLEEDDAATRSAVERLDLPPGFRVTLVPESQPRTKPKACNIGLDQARGEFLVIYDAEDRPEPDQLKKAVAAFARTEPNVICLQCKLNFYNPRQNLLTRWFTGEYSAWFDLSLPGLSALRAVIPLGGTSNHFRTDKLRELRGWDAFNVTEDCDLGVRIHRAGYGTRMLDTTTWEEACSSLPFWIRQRSRWLKGYMQTYLVHTRQPLRLLKELGVVNFLHFNLLIGGIVVCFLLNPLYWFLALLWFLFRLEVLVALFPGLVFAMGALCLFVGNFAFVYAGALGCYRRSYFDLVKYALLAPPYWVLMSYSGWRALWKLVREPFYWEKTRHGLADTGGSAQA